MSSALTTMTGSVPAHIQKLLGLTPNANAALAAGVAPSYPIISYKGKVWHIVESGERTLITINDGGPHTDAPAPSLLAVIIEANENLNKVYYPDGYEEGNTERPLCHSDDGITPSNDAQEKQAAACGACQFNQWGSKISDNGSRGKACADSRRMAIASPDDIENPMLLRCPAASLKTLLAFGVQLDKRGWPFHAIVTRIGFDASLAYPSLTFAPERWLTEDELAQVMAMKEDDLVLQITAKRPQPMADAPNTPTQAQPEDAFARMEAQMGGAPAPAAEAEKPKRKPRTPKAQATPAEVAAAVQAAPPPAEPEEQMHVAPQPARRGFGRAAPAPVAQTQAAPPSNGHDTTLGDEALSELEDVLAGFDDEDEGDEE